MKKGISPVIATVLLIAISVVIALIVFLWFKGINEEAITKFDGTNVKLICEEVTFNADYSDTSNTLFVTNTGNVAIYKMKAKVYTTGAHSTNDVSGWPDLGLNQGSAYSGTLSLGSGDTLVLIPVLLGKTNSGNKAYTCDERYGLEVVF